MKERLWISTKDWENSFEHKRGDDVRGRAQINALIDLLADPKATEAEIGEIGRFGVVLQILGSRRFSRILGRLLWQQKQLFPLSEPKKQQISLHSVGHGLHLYQTE